MVKKGVVEHRVTQISNSDGGTRYFEYDSLGRAIATYDEDEKERVDVSYKTVCTTCPRSFHAWSVSSDTLDTTAYVSEWGPDRTRRFLTEVTNPRCSGCGVKYKYDGGGNICKITYENGVEDTFAYDIRGNMTLQIKARNTPIAQETRYVYHDDFNLPTYKYSQSVVKPSSWDVTYYLYDDNGNMVKKIESGWIDTSTEYHDTTTYEYNFYGQLTKIDGPRSDVGDTTCFVYEANGDLKYIIQANGDTTEYGDRDHLGNLTWIKDPNGVLTRYFYDQRGRLTKVINHAGNPDSTVTEYTYNFSGNITQTTLPRGNSINYGYDSNNWLRNVVNSVNDSLIYYYDNWHNRIREEIRDSLGNIRKFEDYEYNNKNLLTRIINPDSTYTEFEYDEMGNRISRRDANGNYTYYEYDELNRLTKTIQMLDSDSLITQFFYDAHDNLIKVIDPDSNVFTYKYSDRDNLIEDSSSITGVTKYSYDQAGNLVRKINSEGDTITYEYDELNRLTEINFPDSTQNISYVYYGSTVSGTVDSFGFEDSTFGGWVPSNIALVDITNENSHSGRLSCIIHGPPLHIPRARITKYFSSPEINVDVPYIFSVWFYYDLPLGGQDQVEIQYTIDYASGDSSFSEIISQLVGEEWTFLQFEIHPELFDSVVGISIEIIGPDFQLEHLYCDDIYFGSYAYGKGRLFQERTPACTTTYRYDAFGRLYQEFRKIDGILYTTTYEYDKNGNIEKITYPSGREIKYFYDGADRLSQVMWNKDGHWKTLADSVTYAPYGGPISYTYGNGITTRITYDYRYLIDSLRTRDHPILNRTYTYDPVGNITQINDNLDTAKSKTFAYDDLSRLVSAISSSFPSETIGYTYSGNGNRLTKAFGSDTTFYAYSENKLVSSSGFEPAIYRYDNRGNVIFDSTAEYQHTFEYNQNNRLISVNSGALARYYYDGEAKRVKKVCDGTSRVYLYDQFGNLICEMDTAGRWKADYVYLNGKPLAKIVSAVSVPTPMFKAPGSFPDEPNKFYRMWGFDWFRGIPVLHYRAPQKAQPLAENSSSEPEQLKAKAIAKYVCYYHVDHLGTPLVMTGKGKRILWRAEYYPFGEIFDEFTVVSNEFRFPGQYHDRETDLYYNWHRFYKSTVGRYCQTDPVKRLSAYFYAYVSGNPLKYIDRLGLVQEECNTTEGLCTFKCTIAHIKNKLEPVKRWFNLRWKWFIESFLLGQKPECDKNSMPMTWDEIIRFLDQKGFEWLIEKLSPEASAIQKILETYQPIDLCGLRCRENPCRYDYILIPGYDFPVFAPDQGNRGYGPGWGGGYYY